MDTAWRLRAARLFEECAGEIRDGDDECATLDAALTALRIADGELPASEMGWLPVFR